MFSLGIGLQIQKLKSFIGSGFSALFKEAYVSSNAIEKERDVQGGNCVDFNGTNQSISAPHLVGTETVVSSNGASTPTISAGSIGFTAGISQNLILSDGTIYQLDEKAGTMAFDASGNGNHGTYINAPNHTQDSTLPAPTNQNEVGYTNSSGVLIPRDESDITKDVLGNDLQYKGSVYPVRPKLRNSNCLDFNGTNQYGDIGLNDNSDNFDVEISINTTDNSSVLFSNRATSTPFNGYYFRVATGGVMSVLIDTVSSTHVISSTTVVNDGADYTVRMTWDGALVSLYVDGVLEDSEAVTGTIGAVANYRVGRDTQSSSYINAKLWGLTIKDFDGTVRGKYPISEGSGNTSYDISGNGNDISLINAPTWTTQDVFHNNVLNGFSLYEHATLEPIRVPYLSGSPLAITPPTGYTKTSDNPSVPNGYNNAETVLDIYNIAVGDIPSPSSNINSGLTAIGFNEDLTAIDSAYIRLVSTVANDRLIAFPTNLTGDLKALAEKYTQ